MNRGSWLILGLTALVNGGRGGTGDCNCSNTECVTGGLPIPAHLKSDHWNSTVVCVHVCSASLSVCFDA